MKSLGLLFGCDLLLDTDDAEIAQKASDHLENEKKRSQRLTDIETMEELSAFK